MPTLTDTTLVIRCPYCMVGIESRPMIACKDGRFVCRDCAHAVRPGVPEYGCTCRTCLRMAREDDDRTGNYFSRIVFVTQESDHPAVLEALNFGAAGYVVKMRVASDLLNALDAVLDGGQLSAQDWPVRSSRRKRKTASGD